MTRTHEQFIKDVYSLVGDEYLVVGVYLRACNKIKIKHNNCGNEYEVTPCNFLRGIRCPYCNIYSKRTQEKFVKEVYNLVGDEYEVIGEYTGSKNKINMRHNICGNVYGVAPYSILSGHKCPKCVGNQKKTTDIFKNEVFSLHNGEYKLIGEYISTREKTEILHTVCGSIYLVVPNSFLRGSLCPKCASEQQESRLARQLKDYFIVNYGALEEYKIPNMKNNYKYDIFIPSYNIYVEVNGQQHYRYSTLWHKTKKVFEDYKYRDKIKKQHAKRNGTFVDIDIRKYDFENAISYIESFM